MAFILHFVYVVNNIIDLQMYEPYIPGINTTWSGYMILLMHSYIQFANILLSILASMFTRNIGL